MGKRILFVTPTLKYGGGPMQLFYLCRGLQYLGWEMNVASLVSSGPMESVFRDAGLSLSLYHRKGKFDCGQARFIQNIIRAERIDLVNAWGYTTGVWMSLPHIFSRSPNGVLLTTNLRGIEPGRTPAHRLLDRVAAMRVDKFFTNSESTRDYALKWYGISADDVVVIQNGFDVGRLESLAGEEEIRETRNRLNVPLDAILVIQVTRIDPVKNLQDMLRAAKMVINDNPDIYFLLLGSGESDVEKECEDELRIAHKKLQLGGRFLMPGASTNPLVELAASDIYLQTSASEGMPNSVMEAMASGIPIVATDVGDTAKLVNRDCGFLVSPGDVGGMVDAIMILKASEDHRRRLGAAGRRIIFERFGVERMVEAYDKHFKMLIEERMTGEEEVISSHAAGGNRAAMKFSVLIPTYNRPDDLTECVLSAINQSLLPSEILIIDDGCLGDDYINNLRETLASKEVRLIYHKKESPGQADSKNLGMRLASEEIVFVFDDDVIVRPGFFENIMKIWENSRRDGALIGVGGLIENDRRISRLEKLYNRLFCLSSKISWDVTDVGYQVWDSGISKPEKGHYMHGGVSSYRRELALKFPFRKWSGGRTALGEIDTSLRMKLAGFYTIQVPSATVYHKESDVSRETMYRTALKEGLHRRMLFRDNCKPTLGKRIKFVWSSVGWVLRQFLIGKFARGFAMIRGLFVKGLR